MGSISLKKAMRMKQQSRLQKDLLKKVEKGKIGAADAESMLKKKGFEFNNPFNGKLLEAQRKFLMSHPRFVKGLHEFERVKKEREEFEKEEFPKLQFEGFKTAFKLMKRGKWSVDEFARYVEELNKLGFHSEFKAKKGDVLKWAELSDFERFKINHVFFKEALGLYKKGKINREQAVKLGKVLGLRNPRDWWANYFQEHPDRKRRRIFGRKLKK